MGKTEKFCSQVLQQNWCVNKTLHFSRCIAAPPAKSVPKLVMADRHPAKHLVMHGNLTAQMVWSLLLIFR